MSPGDLLGEAGHAAPHDAEELLAEAETEVRAAIDDIREIAHGIYPAALADLGLGAALESLGEGTPVPVVVDAVPATRLPAAIESTAYFVVAEAADRTGATRMRVRGDVIDGTLRMYLALDGVDAGRIGDLTELEDRVGALDGTMTTRELNGSLVIEVEIPCES